MTSAEQQKLAAIERQLTDESPDLVRALAGGRRPDPAARRRRVRARVGVLLACLVLLVAGTVAGMPVLAVFSLCPLLTYLLLAAVQRYARSRSTGLG